MATDVPQDPLENDESTAPAADVLSSVSDASQSEAVSAPAPREAAPAPTPGLQIREGLALNVKEADALAASEGVRILMPLGPVKVGKTTLAVEIYDHYLRSLSWAGASFRSSRSLLDFELIAFPSRLTSAGDIPETWRTRLTDTRYLLHLELLTGGTARHLLIANQSGEFSKHVRDGGDPAIELPLLPRAERVLICVDGASMASGAQAARAISETRQLIGTLVEGAIFASGAQIALVLTKLDLAGPSGFEAWTKSEPDLREQLEPVGGARSFAIAARGTPPAGDNEFEDLFRWVLAEDPISAVPVVKPSRPLRSLARQECGS